MTPIFFTVRYSFWQRIPRFIEHIVKYDFSIKAAWVASRAEHDVLWKKDTNHVS